MRTIAGGILATIIVAIVGLALLSLLFGRFIPVGYPPFFFGWWIVIPLSFFGFFFFLRCWGWGYWYPRRYYQDYDPALETLRERFARGEITKEQYDLMRLDLERTQ